MNGRFQQAAVRSRVLFSFHENQKLTRMPDFFVQKAQRIFSDILDSSLRHAQPHWNTDQIGSDD